MPYNCFDLTQLKFSKNSGKGDSEGAQALVFRQKPEGPELPFTRGDQFVSRELDLKIRQKRPANRCQEARRPVQESG